MSIELTEEDLVELSRLLELEEQEAREEALEQAWLDEHPTVRQSCGRSSHEGYGDCPSEVDLAENDDNRD
jgi:hypothetical protein